MFFKSVFFSLRIFLGKYPNLFFLIYGLKKRNKNLFINTKTRLVVSAYPRTANTFFIIALQQIQKQPISIAHHLHVPALALKGIKKKIPTVILIRNPKDSIVSLVIREKHISVRQAINAYISFYLPLLKYKDKILIIEFSTIINDFPSVITKINSKYQLGLNNYSERLPLNEEKIFKEIESINKKFNKNNLIESMVSRPSQNRKESSLIYKTRLEQKKNTIKLKQCYMIYESLLA